jgi:regulator of sigma E protease
MGMITFLLVISVLIFFHELGHFTVAKILKVKVYVFSIGFGKELFQKTLKGTKWQISLIPLGGYVKMKGQEDLNPILVNNDDDSYGARTPFQRILILLSGPLANFILAFFLYTIVGMLGNNYLSATIGKVIKNSPAQKTGLMVNDEIIRINNTTIKTWNDLSKIIKNSKTNLKVYVKRDNKIKIFIIKPKLTNFVNIFKENTKKQMIGIAPSSKIITVKYNLFEAISFAVDKTYQASKMIFLGLQKMIQGIIPTSEIGGIVSIGTIIAQAGQSGIVALLTITALISVNLGVLNLLPIPALDGGHIVFNLYEMLTKKRPSLQILTILTIVGWIILILLMALGLYNDINRLIG